MRQPSAASCFQPHLQPVGRRGYTLLEVLAAIFIMGVGLLAILTLFPVGALELARAIQDDRATAVAQRAVALSQAGQEVLARTRAFAFQSLIRGRADSKTAGILRRDYQQLLAESGEIEYQLGSLRTLISDPRHHRLLDTLLSQVQYLKTGFSTMAYFMQLLENGL